MPDPSTHKSDDAQLKTLRTIWFALVSGVAMFLVITLFVRGTGDAILVQKDMLDFSSMLVIVGVMVALIGVLAYFTIPALVVNTQRQALAAYRPERETGAIEDPRSTSLSLTSIYQTQFIIGLALLEGGAFLNLVVFMLEGSPVSLTVAVALLVFMLARVPTRSGLHDWTEQQQRLLRDETYTRRSR